MEVKADEEESEEENKGGDKVKVTKREAGWRKRIQMIAESGEDKRKMESNKQPENRRKILTCFLPGKVTVKKKPGGKHSPEKRIGEPDSFIIKGLRSFQQALNYPEQNNGTGGQKKHSSKRAQTSNPLTTMGKQIKISGKSKDKEEDKANHGQRVVKNTEGNR